jgi:D-alanyl-D-alanine carboxypeptidase/D-alanyl-D-alanine-endopeptidase (penicillin-binding protein 4)
VIRRLLVPVLLIVIALGASLQAQRVDEDSDPGFEPDHGPPDFVVGTPMLSVRRTPEWLRQPLADNLLEAEVRVANLTRVTPPSTCIVVHRDVETTIASIQAGDLLVPASNQKLLTAAAILRLAPPSETFSTEVVHRVDAPLITPDVEPEEGEEVEKTFGGDLWLIGGGDPVLSTPGYIDRYAESRAYTDFTMLADLVAEELTGLGVTRVSGGIIADESRYLPAERDYTEETVITEEPDENGDPIEVQVWKDSFRDENQAGPLSALLLNDGYTSWPEDPLSRIENVRADDPALAAADTLRALLEERGIIVEGASRNAVSGEDVATPRPAERLSLGLVESPQLGEIVARMLTHSDNTTAEMLLKEIGVRSGAGSPRVQAVLGMAATLADAGYPMTDIVIADGSGLSSLNQIRCTLIIEILDEAGPESTLVQGMAVVGESGTLRGCLETRTDVSDVSGKTGTLNEVSAFSGVTVADNGDVISFAMLANGEGVGALGTCDLNEELQNEMQLALIDAVVGHPYGPDLADLGPLSAVSGS